MEMYSEGLVLKNRFPKFFCSSWEGGAAGRSRPRSTGGVVTEYRVAATGAGAARRECGRRWGASRVCTMRA